MLTWEDVKDLPLGTVLYEERWRNNYVEFLPYHLIISDEMGIVLNRDHVAISIPKGSFPVDNLYLDE